MTDFLMLAFIFLIAGVIAVPIATRFGLGSVLGYLIAGVAIAPVLGQLGVDIVSIQHFAEFGVVMMLFLVGLELEPERLWALRTRLLGLGGLQVSLTILAVTGILMGFGLSWPLALASGFILSLSSTAIVLQTLNERGLMRSDGGQSSFSVLLFQDIAVIPMLAFIPLLAIPELTGIGADAASHAGVGDHGAGLSLVAHLNGWQAALVTIAAVAAVVLSGRWLTRPLFRFIARAQLRELFTAAALMIVVGIALLMALVGLSPALGAFVAGVVLANSEYRHELESDIMPFRGLLLGVFFMTVGAGIDFMLLADEAMVLIGGVVGLIALKAVILLGLGRLFGVNGSDRWLLALGLAQAGEFGFVLLSFTVASNVMPDALADRLSLIVAMSMMLTPLLFILHDRLIAPRFSGAGREADTIEEPGEILIAGHGRMGGIINRMLKAAGHQTTVVDYSSRQIDILARFGLHAYFGDATRPDLLTAAGVERAKLLIIAIDGKEQITKLAAYAVKTYPHLHVMARAVDRDHVYELYEAGCRDIIREVYDSSIRMGRAAFEALGVEHETALEMAKAFDRTDRRAMLHTAQVYTTGVPAHENEAYVARVKEILGPWEDELRAEMDTIRKGGA
ncbi:monovalent cation:proton antiporter-2 (CPA2) family protein [Maricaulaceae bacterium MS644]